MILSIPTKPESVGHVLLKEIYQTAKKYNFYPERIYLAMYRPFFKQWAYFSQGMNEVVFQIPSIFPRPEVKNRVIVMDKHRSKGRFLRIDDRPFA